MIPGCGDPRKEIPHSVILNYTEGTPFDAEIVLVMACKTSTTQVGDETVVCSSDKTWKKSLKCIPGICLMQLFFENRLDISIIISNVKYYLVILIFER